MNNFQGHRLIKLKPTIKPIKKIGNDDWVLDISDFKIYKVRLNKNGIVEDYKVAGVMTLDNVTGEIAFIKYVNTPVSVLRQAEKIAKFYHNIL